MKLIYPTLKRWLGSGPSKSVQVFEIAEPRFEDGRPTVALPNGLWEASIESGRPIPFTRHERLGH